MSIASVSEFLQWHKDHCQAEMFRGQYDANWSLWPSIVRYSNYLKEGYPRWA